MIGLNNRDTRDNNKLNIFPALPVEELMWNLTFLPMSRLGEAEKEFVAFNRYEFLHKDAIIAACNDERNRMFFRTSPSDTDQARCTWEIVWASNKMPSREVWDSYLPREQFMIEFRVVKYYKRLAIIKRLSAQIGGTGLFASDTVAY